MRYLFTVTMFCKKTKKNKPKNREPQTHTGCGSLFIYRVANYHRKVEY